MKIHLVYFSATYTTRTVCRGVAEFLGGDVVEHDITNAAPEEDVVLGSDDILIAGTPVYCGRVPEEEAERLARFFGNGTKAIAIAVYGNRACDDALIELTRIVEHNGFRTIAAAQFIGRHCIFPMVATDRPDNADREKMKQFAEECRSLLTAETAPIELPGHCEAEYLPHKKVPFYPLPTADCTNCGTCARLCPAGAISLKDASDVDASLCIACGRCVVVCPHHARAFGGEMYQGASVQFAKANAERREPEMFFAKKIR